MKIVENSDCIVIDMEQENKAFSEGFHPLKLRIFKDRIEMDVSEEAVGEKIRVAGALCVRKHMCKRRNMKFNYEDLILMNIVMNEIMHPKRLAFISKKMKRK